MVALGAVNLAALDELAIASERKTFLDAQSADLNEAIGTLEDAIRTFETYVKLAPDGQYATQAKGMIAEGAGVERRPDAQRLAVEVGAEARIQLLAEGARRAP